MALSSFWSHSLGRVLAPLRQRRAQPHPTASSLYSTKEYVLEGTKFSLSLLQKVSALVPIPYVGLAVGAASAVIGIGEDISSNTEQRDELEKRVCALLLVMIIPLKEKKSEDIPVTLKQDIEQLTSILKSTTDVLRKIAKQNMFFSLLFKNVNAAKIQRCSKQLETSISNFEVSRHINQAVFLGELALGIRQLVCVAKEGLEVTKQVFDIAQTGLDVASQSLEIAKTNHDLVEEGLSIAQGNFAVIKDSLSVAEEGLSVTKQVASAQDEILLILRREAHKSTTLPSREMPGRPRIFEGRNTVVEDIAHRIHAEEQPRIAILGPGGIGKTSTALAVMEHQLVKTKFGENCFWVPCVEAGSSSQFLDILVSGMRITQNTGDRLHDILSDLRASSAPRLVLLDDFDTPWNIIQQADIERILCALSNVPHLAILLTIRSNYPPSDEINWDFVKLSCLDAGAARRLYLAIHAGAKADPALDMLLAELNYTPLAIALMAKLGKKSGDMPTALLKTWRGMYTTMLDVGSSSMRSISFSIRLSINNPIMEANPDAIIILTILSMLPGGVDRSLLYHLAPRIANVSLALATLTDSSLIELRPNSQSIHVHPLVRSYVLLHHPLNDTFRKDLNQAFYQFVDQHKSKPGDPNFHQDVQALQKEATNIQIILTNAARDGSDQDALNALLSFSWYQYWTRPRTEIIDYTVKVARDTKNDKYLAEGLRCLGHIYLKLDRFDDACASLMQARSLYQSLRKPLDAAQCLLKLSELYMSQQRSEDFRVAVEKSQEELEATGDVRGIAEGLLHLGEFYWYTGRFAEAHVVFECAQQDFILVDDQLGVANCRFWTSKTYYNERRYTLARQTAEEALRDYRRLAYADREAECLLHVCRILNALLLYPEAFEGLVEGLHKCQELGRPIGIAQFLQELGSVYMKQGEYDQACWAYEESREQHNSIDSFLGRFGAACCLESLGNIYRLQLRYEAARTAFEVVCGEYQALGYLTGFQQCIEQLEDILAKLSVNPDFQVTNRRHYQGLGTA